ncbi:MAG: virulence protein RhuM/Fic/DOC family protein [Desulfovibrionales bacterium]|nr:virulence protein RhuM/Fic/DOC family protein [Desulfovibrionales bacterium]
MSEIAIYQDETSSIEVLLEQDTLWISQEHMALLFAVQKAAISKHLKNIYTSGELERGATVSKKETVQREGARQVTRRIDHYNLDAVISVGYRVNSARATRFRQWATRVLRGYLTRDFALNRKRFETNAKALEATLQLAKKAAQSPMFAVDAGRGLVDIIARYTQTFLLLQRYDQGLLTEPRQQSGGALPTVEEARQMLAALKTDLVGRSEATALFAQERGDGLAALLGNLEQTVFGEPAYPSIEAKAAHLLYFVIKNHPFADGNKRSGAFLFVDFLNRNQRLFDNHGAPVFNDMGLAALALLVAESDPAQKEAIIQLIMNMLSPGA